MVLSMPWSDSEVGTGLIVRNQVVWLEVKIFSIFYEAFGEDCVKKVSYFHDRLENQF